MTDLERGITRLRHIVHDNLLPFNKVRIFFCEVLCIPN